MQNKKMSRALAKARLKILKFDPGRARPVFTASGPMSLEKFRKLFAERLIPYVAKFPDIYKLLMDPDETFSALESFAEVRGISVMSKEHSVEIHPDVKNLDLYYDITSTNRDPRRFFCAHKDGKISAKSGDTYLGLCGMSLAKGMNHALRVVPHYSPRAPLGAGKIKIYGRVEDGFNTYSPPFWKDYPEWDRIPATLPLLFKKLVWHLFPLKLERTYFLDWLHESIFSRSFVYLILCGAPGIGKNTLKVVVRALHGERNVADGKKSSLDKFNGQLHESTLAWFDELRYDSEMENVMKELQNDSVAIERKGIDTTKSTKIHASFVIANNKPRDNFIAFDARKFAPLVLNSDRLEKSMTKQEIIRLAAMVTDESSDGFDKPFIAQIAKWLQKRGTRGKFHNLEYRGPMFWKLAHTSMSRWQKKALQLLKEEEQKPNPVSFDPQKGFLWSKIQERSHRKHGDKSLQFPDFTTVQAFFEAYRDSAGNPAFDTESVANDFMDDFWVRPLNKPLPSLARKLVTDRRMSTPKGMGHTKYDL